MSLHVWQLVLLSFARHSGLDHKSGIHIVVTRAVRTIMMSTRRHSLQRTLLSLLSFL